MTTPAPDLDPAKPREASPDTQNGHAKPLALDVQAAVPETPKNGVGAKIKAWWASLDVDLPTALMMLK
jgi:hypothetical protein